MSVRLAHIEDEDVFAGIQPTLQFLGLNLGIFAVGAVAVSSPLQCSQHHAVTSFSPHNRDVTDCLFTFMNDAG
jgi:hypothetical protein